MVTARLDQDGKLELPEDVLEVLGLEPGDEITVAIEKGRAIIARAPQPGDQEEDAMVQAAIDEYLRKPKGPTYSVEEVEARLNARLDRLVRERDAA